MKALVLDFDSDTDPRSFLCSLASDASPIAFNFPLGSETLIGNNAPRAGNNSQPQQGYRLEPQHERVSDTVHSFCVRFERTCAWGEQYWISVAH
jgi:hypothetical protein